MKEKGKLNIHIKPKKKIGKAESSKDQSQMNHTDCKICYNTMEENACGPHIWIRANIQNIQKTKIRQYQENNLIKMGK